MGRVSRGRRSLPLRRDGHFTKGGNAIVVRAELLKGTDQPVRVSDHACAGRVCGILPLPGEPQLQEHGGKWRENHHQQGEDSPAASSASLTIIPVAIAEPRSPVGNPSNGSGDGCSDRTDENVIVADVGEFVGNDAFQFVIIHQFEQTLGYRHRCVARVSARSKSVRGRLGNQVQFWHGQIGFRGKALHDGVQARQLFPSYWLGTARQKRDFVGEEISKRVREDGQTQTDGHAIASSYSLTQEHQQERKSYQQAGCSKNSHSYTTPH